MKFCHLTWCMYKRSLSGFDIYFSALVEITTQNQLIILRCPALKIKWGHFYY